MNDVLRLAGAVLEGGWRLLTETTIPGLDFSPAALLVGLLMASFGFRVLSYILDWRFSMDDSLDMADWLSSAVSGHGYGGSRGGDLTISKERQHDEF